MSIYMVSYLPPTVPSLTIAVLQGNGALEEEVY